MGWLWPGQRCDVEDGMRGQRFKYRLAHPPENSARDAFELPPSSDSASVVCSSLRSRSTERRRSRDPSLGRRLSALMSRKRSRAQQIDPSPPPPFSTTAPQPPALPRHPSHPPPTYKSAVGYSPRTSTPAIYSVPEEYPRSFLQQRSSFSSRATFQLGASNLNQASVPPLVREPRAMAQMGAGGAVADSRRPSEQNMNLPRRILARRAASRRARSGLPARPQAKTFVSGLMAIYRSFLHYTTLHGLPNSSTSPTIRGKIFWCLVFLFCFSCCASQLHTLVSQYMRFEKNIELDVQFSALPFPSVTFCSINPFEKGKALRHKQIRSLHEAYESALGRVREHKKSQAASTTAASAEAGSGGEASASKEAEKTLFEQSGPVLGGSGVGGGVGSVGSVDVDALLKSLAEATRRKRSASDPVRLVRTACAPHPRSGALASLLSDEEGGWDCVCARGGAGGAELCGEVQAWVPVACDEGRCGASAHCGPLSAIASTQHQNPFAHFLLSKRSGMRCLCNIEADACFLSELALPQPSHVRYKRRTKKKSKKSPRKGSKVLGLDCYQDSSSGSTPFYFPSKMASARVKESGQKRRCLCVEDEYSFQAYCAPPHFWMVMACSKEKCLADNFCGRFENTLTMDTAAMAPLKYQRCICNLLADGCYSWGAVDSSGFDLSDSGHSIRLEKDAAGMEDSLGGEDVGNIVADLGKTANYSAMFENMTDEMAVQSLAKETLLFIGGEISKEEKINMSYSQQSLIKQCSYNGEACDMERDFKLRVDPFYGNCYTYNHDATFYKNSTRAGAIYGLRVMVEARLDDYLFTTDSAGFRLAIHDHKQEPFPDVFGQSAPNGFMSSFGVKLEKMRHLPAPYGDCTDRVSDTYRQEYIFEEDYSVEGCYRSCYQHKVLSMCHCGDARFPVPNAFKSCTSDDKYAMECLKAAAETLGNFNKVSGCHCPKPCKEYVFSATYSGSIYPARFTRAVALTCEEGMSNETCLQEFKRNVAVIEVFYERLNYQALSEIPAYGFTTLVSDIGGIFGLWMGASVITGLEFFALVFELAHYVATSLNRSFTKLTSKRRRVSGGGGGGGGRAETSGGGDWAGEAFGESFGGPYQAEMAPRASLPHEPSPAAGFRPGPSRGIMKEL